MTTSPPRAECRPTRRTYHDITLTDDYAWLRAENWQEVIRDPAVLPADIRGYLEAENAWCADGLAETAALQERLIAEMRGRIKEDDSSVPLVDGPYAYGTSYEKGAEHPRLVRTPREGGAEEVLLDVDMLAKGHAYFELGDGAHSLDHRLLAYSFDDKGSESYTIRVKDLVQGKELADVVTGTLGGVAFSTDSASFLYTWLNDNHRPEKIFHHVIGEAAAEDRLIYHETDPGFFLNTYRSHSGRFFIINSHDHETSEVHLVPADAPLTPPRLVAAREKGVEYHVEDDGEETLFILTNAEGAEDFKIVTAPLDHSDRASWRDYVPHQSGRLILSMLLFKDWLVRLEREGGLPRIIVRALKTGEEHAIAFDEEAYALGLVGGYEFATDLLRFTYSSLTTPQRVFDYDMKNRTRILRKEKEIPSGHDPSRYVTRRIEAPAEDGETVPISLLYAKETPLDGTAPLLLYGYGAYGITIPAAFSSNIFSLIERGFVYAIAHIRGGTDKGRRWYKAGKGAYKENTFKDFIAAAQHVAREGLTQPGRIVALGGSAGGMLMGAVANSAPAGLFGGIIAIVPFVDVLNTMLDDTLPLTPPEWPEWGNPIENAEDFQRIRAYSPYDNVATKAYPAMLVLAGLTDPRVTYWEPAKWVARLRTLKTDNNPLFLHVNMEAGHGGASGRFAELKEIALSYAFALKIMGKTD